MFAVVVTFQIKPGAMSGFLPAMIKNAQTSLSQEPGCHRFDVCTDRNRPNEVFLYELYTDRAAFDAHLSQPHFLSFDNQVSPLVSGKDVRIYQEVAS